ncbi:LOW QUALITY PROTEIN: serine protease 55-like [Lagopus muta]|uniref:LOW QUALITY PROTEIN: serine protease 55-like n=1 Tax=Lagopus muta TaxID=64668 RepID=UPI00209DD27D|nr:LOW QUALITY PROTEIN: serine protease 55-like [Lagopus muta]
MSAGQMNSVISQPSCPCQRMWLWKHHCPEYCEEHWSKSGMIMLLFTFWVLTSLISSIRAEGLSRAYVFFRSHQPIKMAATQSAYSHNECGLRPSFESFLWTGKRITGGRYAKAGEFPWQVSIQSNGKHICGGSIISALWILTAAHCFADEVPPDIKIVMGAVDLDLPLEVREPSKLILHEDFDRITLKHDIALIMLNYPIEFSNEKIPICFPYMDDISSWQHCWVAGWGMTGAVSASHVLQKARMKLISREECLDQIPKLPKDMLCIELEQGSCQVDSGGPLVCSYWNTMKWFQVGVISWGDNCAARPYYQFYTSVYNYYEWIKTETAMTGKPFLIEGMAKHVVSTTEVHSEAKAQLVFLESAVLLFASQVAIGLF